MKKIYLILFVFTVAFTKAQIITTVAGNGTAGYSGDGGPATSAALHGIFGVLVDGNGNIYISDYWDGVIRKVNTSGIISTIIGNGTNAYSGDGGPASAAQIAAPYILAFDENGNQYIADVGNNRIRKINTSGIISTVIGNGTAGYLGNGGLAISCEISSAVCVSSDGKGNLFIADEDNNVVRKINQSGIINNVAGNTTLGFSGDGGQATLAQLSQPTGIAIDTSGNIYIADWNNNRIRKVDLSGVISTIAGNGTSGYNGIGGQATLAQLNHPRDIKLDASGNLYIADEWNSRVCKVDNSGIISIVAGTGGGGYSGDGGLATLAKIGNPQAICFDNYGNLFIADNGNGRIRKVNNVANSIKQFSNNTQLSIYPNPASNTVSISSSKNMDEIKILDVLGGEVKSQKFEVKNETATADISSLQNGIYFLKIISGQESTTRKLVVNH